MAMMAPSAHHGGSEATNNRGVQVISVVEHMVNETRHCLKFCCRDIIARCEGDFIAGRILIGTEYGGKVPYLVIAGSLQGRATFRDKG